MDTKGNIQEHSKVKLELYRLYLERYLYVLFATHTFDSICVHDVFAGCGISTNEEKGSAIIAAETIKKVSRTQNKSGKRYNLIVNDVNYENFVQLQAHLEPYKFASVKMIDADIYIQNFSVAPGSHNLFFIDPHGYTQITGNNLKKLFSAERCDFLIFIPVYHIYRFLRKEEDTEQLKPIASFLEALGIRESDAVSCKCLEDFSDVIESALKKIAGTEFVYKKIIENRTCNSRYGLFFITHNVLGAHKFLEAQNELEQITAEREKQLSFFFVKETSEKALLDILQKGKQYKNTELYLIGIQNGILPKSITKQLKQLENEGKIAVEEINGKKRKRGGFYVGYDHYKSSNDVILIRLNA